MKKLKEKISRISDIRIRDWLKCLSPERRLSIALSLLGTMVIVFIAVVGHGLYRIGRGGTMQQTRRTGSIVNPDFGQGTLPEHQRRYIDSISYNRLNDMLDDTARE